MSDATTNEPLANDEPEADAGASATGKSSNRETGAPVGNAASFNPLLLARARRQLTIRELAKRSGVSSMTITFLENNERLARFNTLFALAEALNVPVENFLGMLDTTAADRGHKGGTSRARREAALAQTDEAAAVTTEGAQVAKAKPSPRPKKAKTAVRNFWLVVYDAAGEVNRVHGPLTEESARELAAGLAAPCRVYKAGNELEAESLHLAWLLDITRQGLFNQWLNRQLPAS